MAITVSTDVLRVLVEVPVSTASLFELLSCAEAWLLNIIDIWFHSTIVIEECSLVCVSLSKLVVLEASFSGLSSVCGDCLQRNGLFSESLDYSPRVSLLRHFDPILIAWAIPLVLTTAVQSDFKILTTAVDSCGLFLCSISNWIDWAKVAIGIQLCSSDKLWLSSSEDGISVFKSSSQALQLSVLQSLGHGGGYESND